MARITVEDCLEHVENRFTLVHAAAKRAKEIARGAKALYKCKNTEIVTALREIAAGKVKIANPSVVEDIPAAKKGKGH